MEKKTSKVTQATRVERDGKPFQDGFKNYYFNVAFENGDKGLYCTNKDQQTTFVVGQDADYTVEEKEKKNKPGETYFKIRQYKEDFQKGGGRSQTPRDVKKEIVSMTMSYALRDAKNFGITSEVDVLNFHERITKHCWKLIDEVQ